MECNKTSPILKQLGGIAMSRRDSQAQWDYPYGWAPIRSSRWRACAASWVWVRKWPNRI